MPTDRTPILNEKGPRAWPLSLHMLADGTVAEAYFHLHDTQPGGTSLELRASALQQRTVQQHSHCSISHCVLHVAYVQFACFSII